MPPGVLPSTSHSSPTWWPLGHFLLTSIMRMRTGCEFFMVCLPSQHQVAAADRHVGAGNEAGDVGGHRQHDTGDVLGLGVAAERGGAGRGVLGLLR